MAVGKKKEPLMLRKCVSQLGPGSFEKGRAKGRTLEPWTVRLWTRTVVARLKVLPQMSQTCGRLFECTCRWRTSFELSLKTFPHVSHGYSARCESRWIR